MGIKREETPIHWNYFLAIEEDLERLSRFVDFSMNDECFSIEISRLFLSACSEIDVVLKQICRNLNPEKAASSINEYYHLMFDAFPELNKFEVLIPRFGLTLHPLEDWKENYPPYWWQDHNKVKHHRHENFEKANLKNALNSIAALYVFTLHLYIDRAENGELLQYPKLFNVGDAHFGGTKGGRWGITMVYRLREPG